MPIRINLLAEQQAAEEMRRRDPVKRAIWVAAGLVALVLLWSLSLQFKILAARRALKTQENELKSLEGKFVVATNNIAAAGTVRFRLDALEKFTANRFLWSTPLNALQHLHLDNIRLESFTGVQTLTNVDKVTIMTNSAPLDLPKKGWFGGASDEPTTNVQDEVKRILGGATNRLDVVPYQPFLHQTVTVSTSKVQSTMAKLFNRPGKPTKVTAKITVEKPVTVTEVVRLSLLAREYGATQEARRNNMDKFYASFTNSQYFGRFFASTNSRIEVKTFTPDTDAKDRIEPNAEFIQFMVEGDYPPRIFSNE